MTRQFLRQMLASAQSCLVKWHFFKLASPPVHVLSQESHRRATASTQCAQVRSNAEAGAHGLDPPPDKPQRSSTLNMTLTSKKYQNWKTVGDNCTGQLN
jgi:hypothetical protein